MIMDMMEPRILKGADRFLKVYANLPLNIRREIVCVLEDEPITWNVAFLEIRLGTKIGEEILNKLKELDII